MFLDPNKNTVMSDPGRQFLTDPLIISKPGWGHIMPPTLLLAHADFQTIRNPWNTTLTKKYRISLNNAPPPLP